MGKVLELMRKYRRLDWNRKTLFDTCPYELSDTEYSWGICPKETIYKREKPAEVISFPIRR